MSRTNLWLVPVPPQSFQRCSDSVDRQVNGIFTKKGPFVANRAVVTLDIGVLLRLPGLDVLDVNAHPFRPCHEFAADVFQAIINPDYGAIGSNGNGCS